jgi:hypothetical protein
MSMRVMTAMLLGLSIMAGAVAPAAAYEGSVIERLDNSGRGGHHT